LYTEYGFILARNQEKTFIFEMKIKKMENLKKLKEYVFHDVDIKGLNIDFEEKELKLSIFEVVEDLNDYKIVEFTFRNITNLKMSECLFNSDSNLEIYSAEIIEINEKVFHVDFNLVNGLHQSSSNISFNFEEVIIKDLSN